MEDACKQYDHDINHLPMLCNIAARKCAIEHRERVLNKNVPTFLYKLILPHVVLLDLEEPRGRFGGNNWEELKEIAIQYVNTIMYNVPFIDALMEHHEYRDHWADGQIRRLCYYISGDKMLEYRAYEAYEHMLASPSFLSSEIEANLMNGAIELVDQLTDRYRAMGSPYGANFGYLCGLLLTRNQSPEAIALGHKIIDGDREKLQALWIGLTAGQTPIEVLERMKEAYGIEGVNFRECHYRARESNAFDVINWIFRQ